MSTTLHSFSDIFDETFSYGQESVKLKKIIVESSKIKKIGKNAFKNIAKKPSVVLGPKLAAAYTKKVVRLLISSGIKAITQIIK